MTSAYEDIFSRFYQRVEDYKLLGYEEEVVNELLGGYLRSTVSKPYVRKLFSSITLDEDVQEITYTMREAWDDLADQDFVEELIAQGMMVEWVKPRYYSVRNALQFISNSESKFYSQSNQMDKLHEMLEKSQNDLRKMIRDRGYSLSLVNSE